MCHLKLAGVAGVAGSVSERKSSKSLPAGNVEIAEQQTTPTFLYESGCRKDLLDENEGRMFMTLCVCAGLASV